jgi:hypothetical protein
MATNPAQIRCSFGVEARDPAQIWRRGRSPSRRRGKDAARPSGQDLRGGGIDLQVEDEEAGRRDLAGARDRPPHRSESRRPQIRADLEEADARLLSQEAGDRLVELEAPDRVGVGVGGGRRTARASGWVGWNGMALGFILIIPFYAVQPLGLQVE